MRGLNKLPKKLRHCNSEYFFYANSEDETFKDEPHRCSSRLSISKFLCCSNLIDFSYSLAGHHNNQIVNSEEYLRLKKFNDHPNKFQGVTQIVSLENLLKSDLCPEGTSFLTIFETNSKRKGLCDLHSFIR